VDNSTLFAFGGVAGVVCILVASRMEPPSAVDPRWKPLWRVLRVNLYVAGIGGIIVALQLLFG